MQAQEFAEAVWSISQRTPDCTGRDVTEAFDRGEILRTHVLRPTWHFVAAADLRWLMALSGPRVHALNGHRYRNLGLDGEGVLSRAHAVIREALAGGRALTRRELGEALKSSGIETSGQRLAHIVMSAELNAVLCSGPLRGKQHTYMLFDDRVPPAEELSREEATARLAQRYFHSRGPATARDFSAWSGLTLTDSRSGAAAAPGIEVAFEANDGPWYADSKLGGPARGTDGALLLGTYDEMVMGYRELRLIFDPPGASVWDFSRCVVIGGVAVGEWQRTLRPGAVEVEVASTRQLTTGEERALRREAERYGRHLGLKTELSVRPAAG
jgi:hypothetical protein